MRTLAAEVFTVDRQTRRILIFAALCFVALC